MPEFRVRVSAWVIALWLGFAAPAGAGQAVDWAARSNTVFRQVAKLRDLQTHTAPLAFAEDKLGFLWAGGEDGLFRVLIRKSNGNGSYKGRKASSSFLKKRTKKLLSLGIRGPLRRGPRVS
jgi:hypothetical protein